MPKIGQRFQKTENYGAKLASEPRCRILNRTWALQVQERVQRKVQHEWWPIRLFQWNEYGLILCNLLMQFTTLTDCYIKIIWPPIIWCPKLFHEMNYSQPDTNHCSRSSFNTHKTLLFFIQCTELPIVTHTSKVCSSMLITPHWPFDCGPLG